MFSVTFHIINPRDEFKFNPRSTSALVTLKPLTAVLINPFNHPFGYTLQTCKPSWRNMFGTFDSRQDVEFQGAKRDASRGR